MAKAVTSLRLPRDLSKRIASHAAYGQSKADVVAKAMDCYEAKLKAQG